MSHNPNNRDCHPDDKVPVDRSEHVESSACPPSEVDTYPTVDAYEKVCAAYWNRVHENERLQAELDKARAEIERLKLSKGERDLIDFVRKTYE